MSKIFITVCIAFLSFVVKAQQDTGIHFTNAANWQQVLDKAKQENKYIFVDCYATWCGPCKYMDKNIFPGKEVGEYINEKFVPVKVQMDRTKKDDAFIQGWYTDAKMLETNYSVGAFPTYLFFSPEGKPLHRFSATTKTGTEFIAKTKKALDPSTQYYATVMEYRNHLSDSAFLRNAIKVALEASDKRIAAEIGNHYFDVINPMVKDNLNVLRQVTLSSKDKGFDFFMKNHKAVDNIMGINFSASVVSFVMKKDEINPLLEPGKTIKNWDKKAKQLKKKYPIVPEDEIDQLGPYYYQAKKNIPAYNKYMLAFMKKYGSTMSDATLNMCAWDIFMTTDDKQVLEEALKWSEKSLQMVKQGPKSNHSNFMDTYANLLYKLGRKEEAIKHAKLAVEIARRDDKENIATVVTATIAKMKNGEPTWQ